MGKGGRGFALAVLACALCWGTASGAQPSTGKDSTRTAVLVVTSTAPGVHVAKLRQKFVALRYPASGPWLSNTWLDICAAPCRVHLHPGLYQLRMDGAGFAPATTEIQLFAGETRLVARPASEGPWIAGGLLGTLGAIGLLMGGTAWLVDDEDRREGREQTFRGAGPVVTLSSIPVLAAGIWLSIRGSSVLSVDRGAVVQH